MSYGRAWNKQKQLNKLMKIFQDIKRVTKEIPNWNKTRPEKFMMLNESFRGMYYQTIVRT